MEYLSIGALIAFILLFVFQTLNLRSAQRNVRNAIAAAEKAIETSKRWQKIAYEWKELARKAAGHE